MISMIIVFILMLMIFVTFPIYYILYIGCALSFFMFNKYIVAFYAGQPIFFANISSDFFIPLILLITHLDLLQGIFQASGCGKS